MNMMRTRLCHFPVRKLCADHARRRAFTGNSTAFRPVTDSKNGRGENERESVACADAGADGRVRSKREISLAIPRVRRNVDPRTRDFAPENGNAPSDYKNRVLTSCVGKSEGKRLP